MDNDRAEIVMTWANMIQRCFSESGRAYQDYGGRGISVCERWHEFENFFQDMRPKPHGLSLDRIDNELGYSPENCRWTDSKTQNNNRRNNVKIECRGETRNLGEWSEESGIKPDLITYRIKQGWDADKAIFTPIYGHRINHVIIEHDGRRGTVKQWEEWTGIPHDIIRTRVCVHGWPAERALSEPVGDFFGGKRGGPRKDNVNLTIDGETKTLAGWSKFTGVPQSTIRNRLRKGMSHSECVFGAERN